MSQPRTPGTSTRVPSRRADPDGFEGWLHHVTERTEPVMTWLGLVFALLVAGQFAVPPGSPSSRSIDSAIWVIWAIFLVDFIAKLALAPAKGRFLRRQWLTVLGLLLPALRFFSFVRLLRLGRALPAARAVTTASRAARTTARVLRSRVGYLAGVVSLGVLALGELIYVFEGGAGGTVPTFGDALVWSAACVIGQSPTANPESGLGQVTMLVAFGLGLVAFSALAGMIGAYLFAPHKYDAAGRSLGRDA